MDQQPPVNPADATKPRWRPLDRVERRVLGVLVEKAKTTPDNYPLSLNALKNGCNQKSNRFPSLELEEDQVEETIERLREVGAVVVIQGGARVDKYRHLAYEWLGVDKVELAVMAELLLRGAQTIGELRGRAARMEPIKDLGELRPILDSLRAKKLILYLTPPGRGAVVTHNLYQPGELEKLRRDHAAQPDAESPAEPLPRGDSPPAWTPEKDAPAKERHDEQLGIRPPAAQKVQSEVADIETKLEELKEELAALRTETTAAISDLRGQVEDLSRQLGHL
jgi:hypothetical protein